MISRREFLRVSALAAAGATLVACGPAATEAPEEEAPAEEPAAEEEKPAEPERPKTWPLGDVPRNRTLVYQYSAPLAGNFAMYGSGFNHQLGGAFIIEPCEYYGVHADKNYPWLAESHSYNADATELTINFRKGIKWSDGTPFTAGDVAWSMELLKRVDGLNKAGNVKSTVEKAEAVDDTTLKVTLNQTDWRFFFTSLTFRFDLGDYIVQPKHYWETIPEAELTEHRFYDVAKGLPITTGAWGVGESNEQYTNYDLRPSWWAVETGFVEKEPDVWRIRHEVNVNDQLAAQALILKEIDQARDHRPFLVAATLAQADHLDTWTGRKPPYGYVDWWPISVQFCTQKPPFDNPKVRWAVAYSLDQQKVLDIAWNGAGKVAYSPLPDYPKLVALLEQIKDVTDKYNVLEFNLEKAAALMEEAGFTKDAEGFWVDKDGVRPEADIYGDANLFGDLAPVVAEQLRQAGFFCQHKSPPDVWAASVDGRAPMFLFGHGGATIDPFDTMQFYQAANAAAMGEQSWGNITRWDSDEFAAVRQEMKNTAMDDPKMVDLFRQMMTVWYEALPDCPLVQWYHRIPVNTWYFSDWPNAENPYMNSALWHLTAPQVLFGLKATGNA
jgi:peptide/nickel transport system substrate-binding protein